MVEELINIHVPELVILIAVDHEEPQIFHRKTADFTAKTLNLFKNFSA
jgi:hypothetical protein